MPSKNFENRQWFYVKRPAARVGPEHYELRETTLNGELSANEVIVRARYISVDPYMRIQQHERNTYDVPHPLGIVQRAGTVGQVMASASERFREGDWVLGYNGWQLFDKCHANDLQKLDPDAAPVSTALGVLGMPGRTAWFGLMEAGRPGIGRSRCCRFLGRAIRQARRLPRGWDCRWRRQMPLSDRYARAGWCGRLPCVFRHANFGRGFGQ